MKFRQFCASLPLLAALDTCAPKATPEDARKFTDDAERNLLALNIDSGRADWIKSTYITDDTEAIDAKLDERAINAQVDTPRRPRASTVSASIPPPPASSSSSNSRSPSPLPKIPRKARN
jgi:hypothetical protein